ncbi:hypothetical protein HT102_10230 [Hoyosella sp. G463]|uniref:Uncharacterized protein n=1 Tax=Lolliginicoccus lacisalsi TaxID=2742202 RepID=A0A927JDK7_9ACTN|nr:MULTISPECIES: hypothetical protein [Lolliginicoccus]MBD8506865.1 hypothetical protein [Lolliginicoccus lacisalsi]
MDALPPEFAMLDMMGMILPIWLEQFSQQQIDLINSLLVPYGAEAMPDADFGLDYDLESLPSASII